MNKVLLKVGASALALTLMAGCGTSNDNNEPADENPNMDQEERQDNMNEETNDQSDRNDPMDEDNLDEQEKNQRDNNN
ncbi:hypothetical protein [Oceanobacillus locisalsi]|uniref:Lipoprotein n=1 Tax=Oceanobacillus locisalsi TaxID=546107 RepID=A0ABW3NAC8_9BACI